MSGNTYSVSFDDVSKKFLEESVRNVLNIEGSKYIKQLQDALQPQVIKFDGKTVPIDKKKHNKFKDVLYKCIVHKQCFMSGPTGSGKTTIAEQIAEAMKLEFYFISCSQGMSEAHLLGRMLFDGSYAPSDLVRAYENGGVYLFDEIDAADSNTLLVINSALSNNRISIPNRKDKPHATRHPNFICLVAGNTWGEGSVEYQGRTALDAAFLDRFAMSKVDVEYDTNLEMLIVQNNEQIYKTIHNLRNYLKSKNIGRAVSTRTLVHAYKDYTNGYTLRQILEAFSIGWSKDEIKQLENFYSSHNIK